MRFDYFGNDHYPYSIKMKLLEAPQKWNDPNYQIFLTHWRRNHCIIKFPSIEAGHAFMIRWGHYARI
jgi:hypothetical protein